MILPPAALSSIAEPSDSPEQFLTLPFDDINVARKHAVIERRKDGRCRLTDLGPIHRMVLRTSSSPST